MSEEALTDDQSHYEVSLTAGQAFLAFVLLLLSLAASFAFGLVIGKGQPGAADVTVRKEPAVINEANATRRAAPAEVAVKREEFQPVVEEPVAAPPAKVVIAEEKPEPVKPAPKPVATPPAARPVPHYAQLFSTSDQKNAEKMAASLIDGGFTSAYVERGATDKGPVFRVRIPFASEAAARAAEPKLKAFSKDVWITKQ